uniref:Uncharacterized protein n=1 Tax=Rheinheimera sp. BAL341 TaxID=1708203 RepID=A0A486XXQ7_9GAMM
MALGCCIGSNANCKNLIEALSSEKTKDAKMRPYVGLVHRSGQCAASW